MPLEIPPFANRELPLFIAAPGRDAEAERSWPEMAGSPEDTPLGRMCWGEYARRLASGVRLLRPTLVLA